MRNQFDKNAEDQNGMTMDQALVNMATIPEDVERLEARGRKATIVARIGAGGGALAIASIIGRTIINIMTGNDTGFDIVDPTNVRLLAAACATLAPSVVSVVVAIRSAKQEMARDQELEESIHFSHGNIRNATPEQQLAHMENLIKLQEMGRVRFPRAPQEPDRGN